MLSERAAIDHERKLALARAKIDVATRAFAICYKPGANDLTWETAEAQLADAIAALDQCGQCGQCAPDGALAPEERSRLGDMIEIVRQLRALAGRELGSGAHTVCQACGARVPSSQCRFVIGINGRPRSRCQSCRGEIDGDSALRRTAS